MIKTCKTCPQMKTSMVFNAHVAYCQITNEVVPHGFTPKELTFWRIPTTCPRPSEEVFKNDKQVDKSDWEFIDLSAEI